MTEIQKAKGFNLIDFLGGIWAFHIVIAALIYPRQLLPNDKDEHKEFFYQTFSLVFGTLILLMNLIGIVLFFTRSNYIDAAKIIFIFFTWFLVGIIYIAFNYRRDVAALFMVLEEAAMRSRDESAMLIQAGVRTVEDWHRKFLVSANVELSFTSILKKCTPLIMLALGKEKTIMRIGFEAFKVFLSNSQLLKKFF